jgi:methylase of polypeptide subunit release factors
LIEGPVLSLSEGEGRNAVFLAARGLEVLGVDISAVALEKAKALAESKGVAISTLVTDLATFEPEAGHYGSVISPPGVSTPRADPVARSRTGSLRGRRPHWHGLRRAVRCEEEGPLN